MKSRRVETKIWEDRYFMALDSNEKLVFAYLLLNERINIVHCFELAPETISHHTKVNTDQVTNYMNKFERDGKIAQKNGYIMLLNSWKYETYTGTTNEEARAKILKEMGTEVRQWHETTLRACMDGTYTPTLIQQQNASDSDPDTPIHTPIDRGITAQEKEQDKAQSDTPIRGVSIPPNINISINTKNVDRDKRVQGEKRKTHTTPEIAQVALNVIHKYNEVWGKSLKDVSAEVLHTNLKHWLTRYTEQQILEALTNSARDSFWGNKMTPEILLRRKNPRGEDVDRIGQFINQIHQEPKKFNNEALDKYSNM